MPPGTLGDTSAEKTDWGRTGLTTLRWKAPRAHPPRAAAGPWHALPLQKYQHCRPSSGRKSQRDSLQSKPTFEFHLQILVPPDKLKPAQMAPQHQKVKITKPAIPGPPFFSGQMCRCTFQEAHSQWPGSKPSPPVSSHSWLLACWWSSRGPSGCVPGRSSGVPEPFEWGKGYRVGELEWKLIPPSATQDWPIPPFMRWSREGPRG